MVAVTRRGLNEASPQYTTELGGRLVGEGLHVGLLLILGGLPLSVAQMLGLTGLGEKLVVKATYS